MCLLVFLGVYQLVLYIVTWEWSKYTYILILNFISEISSSLRGLVSFDGNLISHEKKFFKAICQKEWLVNKIWVHKIT